MLTNIMWDGNASIRPRLKFRAVAKVVQVQKVKIGGREWTLADGFYVTETQKHVDNCLVVENSLLF